jgi:CBS domain-containing protein
MTTVGAVMSTRLISVCPDDSTLDAINRMVEENVGSVVVCEGPRLAGIFTERDVLRLASERRPLDGVRIEDVMTSNPVTVDPFVSIVDAAHLMGERGVRHLPVVEGEYVHGVVGIRDVMRTLVARAWRGHDDDAHETAQELLRRR